MAPPLRRPVRMGEVKKARLIVFSGLLLAGLAASGMAIFNDTVLFFMSLALLIAGLVPSVFTWFTMTHYDCPKCGNLLFCRESGSWKISREERSREDLKAFLHFMYVNRCVNCNSKIDF